VKANARCLVGTFLDSSWLRYVSNFNSEFNNSHIEQEGLASSFDVMGLLEDALLLYDELEASLFQVLKERSLSWFGRLVDPDTTSDTASIFSLTEKPYHHLVTSSSISVFDCRVYLLARQCDLLARMGNIHDLTRRVKYFLNTFPETLGQVKVWVSSL
jgi:trafficking protein particle complex subunit 10